jgi:hypothetical protein
MKAFWHRNGVTRAERAELAGELARLSLAPGATEPACCCPARPTVRVVMPATASRPEPVDLLLCNHHYRASRAALQAAGAAAYDDGGALIMGNFSKRPHHQHKSPAAA